MVPSYYYLGLALILFMTGFTGLAIRKNAICVFMCIELMLNAANILFVLGSSRFGVIGGQISVFFVMVVAAAEAAIGLAITLAFFRDKATLESVTPSLEDK